MGRFKEKKNGGSLYYVRGHLLNDNLHGPGKWKNMTPLSVKGNKNHLNTTETLLKEVVESKQVIKYVITANYGLSVDIPNAEQMNAANIDPSLHEDMVTLRKAEKQVAKGLTVSADLLEKDGITVKKNIQSGLSIENTVDLELSNYELGDAPPKEKVKLKSDTAEKIATNTPISLDNATIIKEIVSKIGSLTRYDQISSEIEETYNGATKDGLISAVATLSNASNVTLN